MASRSCLRLSKNIKYIFAVVICIIGCYRVNPVNAQESASFAIADVRSNIMLENFKGNLYELVKDHLFTYLSENPEQIILVDADDIVANFAVDEMSIIQNSKEAQKYLNEFLNRNTDYLICATITNVSIKKGGVNIVTVGVNRSSGTVEVDLLLDVIDLKTREKVAVVKGKGQSTTAITNLRIDGAKDIGIGGEFIPDTNLSIAVEKAVKNAVENLFKEI